MAGEKVLVIGAGIIGSACAAALAEAGLAVTVVHDPARKTAEASGGHLLLQSKSHDWHLDLARRSLELLKSQILGHEDTLGYRQTGSLILAVDDDELVALREHHKGMIRAGVPVELLSGQEARELEPALTPNVRGATFCSLDAQIDPVELREFYRRKASSAGAAFIEGEIDSLFRLSDRLAARFPGEVIDAEVMVLAAGVWSKKLAQTMTDFVDLSPRRGLLLRARSESVLASRPLLGATYLTAKFREDNYERDGPPTFSLQQHPDGRMILGGTREFAGYDWRVDPRQVKRVIACGSRYVRGLGRLRWGEPTIGYRPWAPGGRPYTCDCDAPGLFLAFGHEGDGITLAAATAEIITEKVTRYLNP
jgi:sarcosine oxidase subunit beta